MADTPWRGRPPAEFDFQGYVGERLVYDGRLIGVPLSSEQMQSSAAPK